MDAGPDLHGHQRQPLQSLRRPWRREQIRAQPLRLEGGLRSRRGGSRQAVVEPGRQRLQVLLPRHRIALGTAGCRPESSSSGCAGNRSRADRSTVHDLARRTGDKSTRARDTAADRSCGRVPYPRSGGRARHTRGFVARTGATAGRFHIRHIRHCSSPDVGKSGADRRVSHFTTVPDAASPDAGRDRSAEGSPSVRPGAATDPAASYYLAVNRSGAGDLTPRLPSSVDRRPRTNPCPGPRSHPRTRPYPRRWRRADGGCFVAVPAAAGITVDRCIIGGAGHGPGGAGFGTGGKPAAPVRFGTGDAFSGGRAQRAPGCDVTAGWIDHGA